MTFKELRIGWSRGKNFIPSGAIRRLDNSYFNHVYWVFVLEDGSELIYESHMSGGVQITPYEHLDRARAVGKVTAIHENTIVINPFVIRDLWEQCVTLHGDSYDTGQIIRYYMWIRLFRRKGTKMVRLNDDGKYTCNEFVVETGRKVIKKMEDLDFSYTPERLFQFVNGMPSKEMFNKEK